MATADLFPTALDPRSCVEDSLDIQVQDHIKNNFWRGSTTSLAEFVSYFRYFQWAINVLLWPNADFEKTRFVVQKHGDLAAVVCCLNEYYNESRSAIATRLQGQFSNAPEDHILRSMDLAVRLWMTLQVRSRDSPIGPLLSDITFLEWREKQSLSNLVAANFPKCRREALSPTSREARIDPAFTIMNLRKICRIHVEWTPNLKDHLRYDRSIRRLNLYPHKVCLLSHLEHSNAFPKDFLRETIRTLDLLFPYGDKSTDRWLESSKQPFHRTSSLNIQLRASNLAEFCYWRRQLVELYDVFQQPPSTITQMWHDRRNPMQWYTFWLAAFIAISSTVFGSIGCYIGFKQIELAERSAQVALAQNSS